MRQLRNAARQLAIASRGRPHAIVDLRLERLLEGVPTPDAGPPGPPARRKPSDITDDPLVEALRDTRWRIGPTARALGIARSSLYVLIDRCPLLRKAGELPREEILAASKVTGGQLDLMAARLEVSRRGLQLRMTELGLGSSG